MHAAFLLIIAVLRPGLLIMRVLPRTVSSLCTIPEAHPCGQWAGTTVTHAFFLESLKCTQVRDLYVENFEMRARARVCVLKTGNVVLLTVVEEGLYEYKSVFFS